MSELHKRVVAAFEQAFGSMPELVARGPGRVNLIGEHTDYNDGFVLPMAIGLGTMVAARRRSDGLIRAYAGDFGAWDEFPAHGIVAPDPSQTWNNYLRGMAHALHDAGLGLSGADLAICGDLPMGAGLSSSASLEMAAGLALAALAGAPGYDKTRLALAGQRAEHEYAGCHCGIMDQLVSARGEAGAALLIDCRTLATRPVALPAGLAVMIVHSGVSRGLVDGEYNDRRVQCETAARHFGVQALRDLDADTLDAGRAGLGEIPFRRARHVVSENARVLSMVAALDAGDLARLSTLMAESHDSMRDDFAITVPQVDQLVGVLQDTIGRDGGARMTGGGFGGAVVAILPQDRVAEVSNAVAARYHTPEGTAPVIMVEQPAAGASLIG